MWKIIFSPVAAGVAISIGGIAYLKTGNPFLFPIGLFIVCFYGLELFTGRICYYSPKNHNLHCLVLMWLLNTLGAYGTGLVMRLAIPDLTGKAVANAEWKLDSGAFRVIPMAIMCNVLIFVAVDTFRRCKGNLYGFACLVFATTAFVACGFEHCIANAFYFGMAGEKGADALAFLVVNAIWNAIGGILAMRLLTAIKGRKQANV